MIKKGIRSRVKKWLAKIDDFDFDPISLHETSGFIIIVVLVVAPQLLDIGIYTLFFLAAFLWIRLLVKHIQAKRNPDKISQQPEEDDDVKNLPKL